MLVILRHIHLILYINLFNESYAHDSSRKIQAIFKSRIQEGLRVFPSVPYGYLRDLKYKQKLIINPKPVEIIQRVIKLIIESFGMNQIANTFFEEKILIPVTYADKHCPENCYPMA